MPAEDGEALAVGGAVGGLVVDGVELAQVVEALAEVGGAEEGRELVEGEVVGLGDLLGVFAQGEVAGD